ncbi:hypothetical protein OPV22_010051 [Ensete ventricosum]|uniref:G-box binding protein multifunctional mosaic region domain-containing protein n=1 Tax=Ensete ventricosum TaxID=4639 RepID=A0AAV8RIC1_ENSVE|nr:hypothetical protein OPV22_010051 [Ensete ventricosum]
MVAQAVVCSSYGGFSGGAPPDATGLTHHHNLGSSLPSSMAPGNPGGYESFGMGSSPYCVPPSSAGMPSGGYPVSPGRRIPGRGLYPNVPPSY